VNIHKIEAEDFSDEDLERMLAAMDGVLIPGGFGARGVEGKIAAAGIARRKKIPFFGICLGMQLAVVEFARNVCGLAGAHSTEMEPLTPHPVIDIMAEQKSVEALGGTMRLGAYDCRLIPGTLAHRAYGVEQIAERHRHRYEVNNKYLNMLQERGLVVSGVNDKTGLVEIIELKEHPWFLGCQFHPEFKSRPVEPHPLFVSFIRAAKEHRRARLSSC
jgi:CTP synthase